MDSNTFNRETDDNEADSEIKDERATKRYLLDDNLFFKYRHLFENNKNHNFLEKVKRNPLIYGKRFYPVSSLQLELLKKNIHDQTTTVGESSSSHSSELAPSSIDAASKATTTSISTTTTPVASTSNSNVALPEIDSSVGNENESHVSSPMVENLAAIDDSKREKKSQDDKGDNVGKSLGDDVSKRFLWKPDKWTSYQIKKKK